jgi:hypothetical protein
MKTAVYRKKSFSDLEGADTPAVHGDSKRKLDQYLPMSAYGTKRTSNYCPAMSAFGGKADIVATA